MFRNSKKVFISRGQRLVNLCQQKQCHVNTDDQLQTFYNSEENRSNITKSHDEEEKDNSLVNANRNKNDGRDMELAVNNDTLQNSNIFDAASLLSSDVSIGSEKNDFNNIINNHEVESCNQNVVKPNCGRYNLELADSDAPLQSSIILDPDNNNNNMFLSSEVPIIVLDENAFNNIIIINKEEESNNDNTVDPSCKVNDNCELGDNNDPDFFPNNSECSNDTVSEGKSPDTFVENVEETPGNVDTIMKRKRKAEPAEWKKNVKKRLRREGKVYEYKDRKKETTNKGNAKLIKAKERKLGPPCTKETCKKSKKRFCQNFSEEVRQEIFKHFWEVLSWDERKTFVSSLVDCTKPVQKRRPTSGDRRGNTLHYHLKIKTNERKEVCKEMFCNTLSLNNWSAQYWAKTGEHGMRSDKNINTPSTSSVRSSKRKSQTDKMAKSKFATEYIDSLPKLESHYCRKDSSKLYLEPMISSFQQLHRLYLDRCMEAGIEELSRTSFRELLSSKNVSLFTPKKDQCDICCQHTVGNLSDVDYASHIAEKDRARAEKEADKKKGAQKKCKVICVDVQAVKLSPCLKASALYYKTKLCSHNYTVFDMTTLDALCYWWDESEGELKSSNFVSCLINYLEELVVSWPSEIDREIIIWSDGCGYQNKNKVLSNALLQFAVLNDITIFQKYLVRGHTQMECDSVHATIEKKLKNRDIYLPHEYISVTKEARMKPFPYRTKCITYDFFKDFTGAKFERFSSIRPGTKPTAPTVHQLCSIKYTPAGKLYYKVSFIDEEFVELERRAKKVEDDPYPQMYKERLKIKQTKFEHLQQLKNVIPVGAHDFYDNLPH